MSVALNGVIREKGRKSVVKELRKEEYLPGILYGQKDNVLLKVRPKELKKILAEGGRNVMIDLKIEGDTVASRQVLLKDYQSHPLKEGWVHVDFIELDMSKKTKVQLPVRLVGHSPGEKLGGLVNHATRTLEIECLPHNIPSEITVNMEEVVLGQVVHVSDLKLSDEIEILNNPGDAVVAVTVEKVKEEKTEEEGAAELEEAAPEEADKKEGE